MCGTLKFGVLLSAEKTEKTRNFHILVARRDRTRTADFLREDADLRQKRRIVSLTYRQCALGRYLTTVTEIATPDRRRGLIGTPIRRATSEDDNEDEDDNSIQSIYLLPSRLYYTGSVV